MINIIIVEDENIVRLGLSALIDWEDQGFHISGLFKNGKEALEFLQKTRDIDIVITDIRMPVMGGEELVRHIRELSLPVDILILSNYDDFEIVKNCFKMGISDYILKQNIEPDSLLELLQGISQKREKGFGDKERKEEETYEFFQELSNRDWKMRDKEFQEKYRNLLEKMQKKIFLVMLYTFTDEMENKVYEGQRIRLDILQECIRENSREYFQDLVILRDADKYLAVLWLDQEEVKNTGEKNLHFWSHRLSTVLQEYFNLTLKAGVSETTEHIEDLEKCYWEALYNWKRLFYFPREQIIFSGEKPGEFRRQNDFFNCLKEVRFCLEFNNFAVLKSSLEKFYSSLKREKDIEPDSVLRFTNNLFVEMNYFLTENTEVNLESFGFEWEKMEKKYFTIDTLRNQVFSLVDKIMEYLKSHEPHYEFIARAKWMISKRYNQDISLQELADMLNMNPGYLSSLFKKKTGISFVQYLTNYRMKKAVEMLRTTENSVEEIAEKVGYQNANYFIKVFKKTVGMTISEFRKNGI